MAMLTNKSKQAPAPAKTEAQSSTVCARPTTVTEAKSGVTSVSSAYMSALTWALDLKADPDLLDLLQRDTTDTLLVFDDVRSLRLHRVYLANGSKPLVRNANSTA